jgi:hypothetical protein
MLGFSYNLETYQATANNYDRNHSIRIITDNRELLLCYGLWFIPCVSPQKPAKYFYHPTRPSRSMCLFPKDFPQRPYNLMTILGLICFVYHPSIMPLIPTQWCQGALMF